MKQNRRVSPHRAIDSTSGVANSIRETASIPSISSPDAATLIARDGSDKRIIRKSEKSFRLYDGLYMPCKKGRLSSRSEKWKGRAEDKTADPLGIFPLANWISMTDLHFHMDREPRGDGRKPRRSCHWEIDI